MLLFTRLAQLAVWVPTAEGTEGRSWEDLKEASRGACAILASGGL